MSQLINQCLSWVIAFAVGLIPYFSVSGVSIRSVVFVTANKVSAIINPYNYDYFHGAGLVASSVIICVVSQC